ncbi:MAG: carbohydrate ABC transporter permease [Thermoanaerobaculaceae bacterium]
MRQVVARLAQAEPSLRAARVVVFDGLKLEASTAAADAGEQAAPRRLTREEKPLYDQGQRLRAAVETNREDNAARKEEVEVAPRPDGGIDLAAPVSKDGTVVGAVLVESAPEAVRAPRVSWLLPLGLLAGAGVVLWGLSLLVGERRLVLVLVGAVLVVGVLVFFRGVGAGVLSVDRERVEQAVATHLQQQVGKVSAALEQPALASGLDAASWDVDAFRRPLGLVKADGTVEPQAVQTAVDGMVQRWGSFFWLLGGVALLLLAFFGFGWAAKTWQILVKHREGYLYVAPAMIAMLVLVFFPFFYGIALSFTGQTIYTTDKSIPEIWLGLENFTEILGDFNVATRGPDGWTINYQNFYWTLGFTIVWTVSNVSFGVTMGLILALILNTQGLALRAIYRVIFILPWAIPNYITALIWKGMFHQQFGVVNQVIQMFGGEPVSWFEKPFTSFLAVLATNGWLSVPFMMVISLGALQSIPADLYEAARVDGAGRWKQFTSITLPSLKPALVPAVILSVVWTFNQFNIIYLVSAGEPAHSTEILITQAFKLAFEQYRYGYAAAYSVVIFLILFIYGTWQNRVTKATEGI